MHLFSAFYLLYDCVVDDVLFVNAYSLPALISVGMIQSHFSLGLWLRIGQVHSARLWLFLPSSYPVTTNEGDMHQSLGKCVRM